MPQRVTRYCKLCNKPFYGQRAFCSQECYKNAGSPRKITRYCKQCNKPFTGHKDRCYCSKECRELAGYHESWNKGLKGTKGKPRNGIEKICEVCNKPFYVSASETHIKRCSQECYLKDRWGDSHKETRTCVICNTPFEVHASAKQITCSKNCGNEYKSRMMQGENCHFWRGGKMAPYVGEWKTQRRAARERDGYKCILCGSTDRIQVHHIIPYRYSHNHDLDNLVTLCRSCHSKEELKVNPVCAQVLIDGRSIRLAFLAERR